MWQAALLAPVLLLAPSQTPQLRFENTRGIHGLLGPRRADMKILPGEMLFVTFDIIGLQAGKTGGTRFSSVMEVADEAGKVVFQKELGEVSFRNVLGSPRVQHSVLVPTGLDMPPGKYQLRVEVADGLGKGKGSFTERFEVRRLEFGLVRLHFTYDLPAQIPMPNVGTVGQVLYLNVGAVGFKRDRANGDEAALSMEMTIRDERGVATSTKPFQFPTNGKPQRVPDGIGYWHVQFDLPVNRAGRFEIELKATDHVAQKTATVKVPFLAVEPIEKNK